MDEPKECLNHQRKVSVSFYRKSLKIFFGRIDPRAVSDIIKFLEIISSFFSKNHFFDKESIILNRKRSADNNEDLAEILMIVLGKLWIT